MFYDTDIEHQPHERGHGPRGHRRHHRGEGQRRGHHRHEGRHGLHSGRKLSSAELQNILLLLLEKSPSHGYELIKALEELSDGYYVPSPGMIYPSLTYLEEIGLAAFELDGAKKRYHLTSAGKENLEAHREAGERILADLAQIGSRMEEARRALSGERTRDVEAEGQSEVISNLRNELRSFLREFGPRTREEEERVAGIFRAAVLAAKGKQSSDQEKILDPKALMAVLKARRSMGLSRLSPRPVDRTVVEQMLEAANWAPSNEDTEPWRFTVFMNEGRERLARVFAAPSGSDPEGARKRAFAAPVWISIGMSPQLREDGTMLMTEDEEIMAVACAVQNLHLMAQALGLAGMWHSKGLSVHPDVARALGLEPPARLLGFFMCGWPAGEWLQGKRGPSEDKVTWVENP